MNKKEKIMILMCWLVYTVAYLGRYSYSVNITFIMNEFNITHSEAGLVVTFFFFAYGIGQVINGILSKRYNKKIIIPIALILSSILNFAVFFGIPFVYIKYLWLINGLLQSILWPTLIEILSKNLSDTSLKTSVVVMSTTVVIGTFLAYGFGSLFGIWNKFKLSFLLGAISMAIVAFIWFFVYGKITSTNQLLLNKEETVAKEKVSLKKAVIITVVILGIFAAIDNLIKDGITTWVPSILKEKFGFTDSLSILLTLTLPVLGLLGTAFATKLSRKIKSFIDLSVVLYVLTLVFLFSTVLILDSKMWYLLLAFLGILSLLTHGINNVVTSMAPLCMRDKMDSGLLAGLLNGCCYIGSTISSYCLGLLADKSGWNSVFYLLLGCSLVPIVIGLISRFFLKSTKLETE